CRWRERKPDSVAVRSWTSSRAEAHRRNACSVDFAANPMTISALAAMLRAGGAEESVLTPTLLEAARDHQVEPLIYCALRASNRMDRQPRELRDALVNAAREAAIAECIRQAEL